MTTLPDDPLDDTPHGYEGQQLPPIRPAGTRCKDCINPHSRLTWAEQRKQYGRCLKHGLTPAEAKAAMPLCQKCCTKFLRTSPRNAEAAT